MIRLPVRDTDPHSDTARVIGYNVKDKVADIPVWKVTYEYRKGQTTLVMMVSRLEYLRIRV